MCRLFVVASLLVTLSACGKQKNTSEELHALNVNEFPNISDKIYGSWKQNAPQTDNKGVVRTFNIYFNLDGVIGYEMLCEHLSDKVRASVAFAGIITGSTVKIEQTVQVYPKPVGTVESCELKVSPVDFDFTVNGDELVLTQSKVDVHYTRILP